MSNVREKDIEVKVEAKLKVTCDAAVSPHDYLYAIIHVQIVDEQGAVYGEQLIHVAGDKDNHFSIADKVGLAVIRAKRDAVKYLNGVQINLGSSLPDFIKDVAVMVMSELDKMRGRMEAGAQA